MPSQYRAHCIFADCEVALLCFLWLQLPKPGLQSQAAPSCTQYYPTVPSSTHCVLHSSAKQYLKAPICTSITQKSPAEPSCIVGIVQDSSSPVGAIHYLPYTSDVQIYRCIVLYVVQHFQKLPVKSLSIQGTFNQHCTFTFHCIVQTLSEDSIPQCGSTQQLKGSTNISILPIIGEAFPDQLFHCQTFVVFPQITSVAVKNYMCLKLVHSYEL